MKRVVWVGDRIARMTARSHPTRVKLWNIVGIALAIGVAAGNHSVPAQRSAGVRLALVNVPDEMLRPLLPSFQRQYGLDVSIVYTGNDPFAPGRAGDADLVIAHFGHAGVERFVSAGHGLWPKTVFANQMALFGPPGDPAGVRGVTDLATALRRIESTKSRYVANASDGARYLTEIAQGGKRLESIESKLQNAAAVRTASDRGAYVLWGLPPFMRLKRQQPIEQPLLLEPLVIGDPLLQRIMVAIVVNPESVKGVNATGAKTFQEFLLSADIQARIAAFRYPDFDQQVWWPAGRHNSARD